MDLSKSSRGEGGDWVAEARWWEEHRAKIQKEKEDDQIRGLGGASRVLGIPQFSWIPIW
ncbi:hypothetical protein J3R82DRAFT_2018 [Butyriboletus roseoflavus]|nr:hypothetical protein J3R82DRAFT_2018 [Butyriboletus roseoflavus]